MDTINVSELLNAGINFTIEDERTQRSFSSSDGELFGVSFELVDYVVYEFDGDDDAICDINELRDSDDRWAHVGDAHVRELELQRALYTHLSVDTRCWREYYHLSQWRIRRYKALSRYIKHCSSPAKLKRIQKGMWSRYRDSCKACAVNGTWWALYLTKQQANALYELIETML